MKISLVVSGRRKAASLRDGASIADVIRKEKLNGETLIVRLNGRLAHEDAQLKAGDRLELIGVIYGG